MARPFWRSSTSSRRSDDERHPLAAGARAALGRDVHPPLKRDPVKVVPRLFLLLSSLSFAALTAVTLYEVVARYVFRAPTSWSLEVSSLLLCYGSLGALVYATWERAHICVDLLHARMTPTTRRRVDVVGGLAFVAVLVVIAWLAMHELMRAIRYDERQTGDLGLPIWTTLGVIPVFAVTLATLVLVQTLVADARNDALPSARDS